MTQIIDRVTITGADDSIDPADLVKLTEDFPFVEWGILLSSAGKRTRFPSPAWLRQLKQVTEEHKLPLSGHLCGRYVREACQGDWEFINQDLGDVVQSFQRFQLNFHAIVHRLDEEKFIRGLRGRTLRNVQFIFQLDDINNHIVDVAKGGGVNAVPLFDLSGGIGVLPDVWPEAREGYCGYAGGLSPDNIEEQLPEIEKVAGEGPVWIDIETHVRSENDRQFELSKVREFLEKVEPWVPKKEASN